MTRTASDQSTNPPELPHRLLASGDPHDDGMDPLEYLFSLEKLGIKFGLENIRALCDSLGHPERRYRSVVVGGTNGKGSVTAMVAHALQESGHRTARYTSPHLVHLEERFVIDGARVTTQHLRETTAAVRAKIDELRSRGALSTYPTFFEVTTAVGFEVFRRAGANVAVLEVGMGGRFDATNVVDPVAVAITTIDLDHEQYLGSTIAAVAGEKAGIIKPGIPVIVGETKPDAVEIIRSVCAREGARFLAATADVEFSAQIAGGRTVLDLTTPRRKYPPVTLALRGRHQILNAIIAVRTLEALDAAGVSITAEAIVEGLRNVVWPGRLDVIDLGRGRHVLFDSAHNPAGAAALAAYLHEVYPQGLPIVFAAMRDKDAIGMLRALLPCATRLIVTEVSGPRASRADALAHAARELSPTHAVEVIPDAREALGSAVRSAEVTCVAGSIFLVGELIASVATLREGALDGQ